jgi:signal transduction histidine kinase
MTNIRLQELYQNYVTNGLGDQVEQSTLERIKTLNMSGGVLVLLSLAWAMADVLVYQKYATAAIEAAGFLGGLAFLLLQRKIKNTPLAMNIAVALLTLILFGTILPVGIDSNETLWVYLLPSFAFFLTGVMGGLIWTAITLVAMIALILAQEYLLYPIPLRDSFALNLILSYIVVALFSYQYERARWQAEQTLYQKNSELQRLIYTVSHDLKTPVVSLIGYLSFIKEEIISGDDVQRDQDLQKMTIICQNMRGMINDLLSLSRIKKEGTYSHVAVEEIVKKILTENESQLRAAHIQTNLEGTFPTLYTDQRKIEEIFRNLISNAIKYIGDKAERNITIGVTKQDADYRFYVRDNGIGIPASEKDRIFSPFYTKTTTSAMSSGIGLSIAKGFVTDLGGTIWVESQEGDGSTFWFTLPASFSTQSDLPVSE